MHRNKSEEEEIDSSSSSDEAGYGKDREAFAPTPAVAYTESGESDTEVLYTDVGGDGGSLPKKSKQAYHVETRHDPLDCGPVSVANTPNRPGGLGGPTVDEAHMVCTIYAANMVGMRFVY
jgi:hypothetical protein